MGTSANTNAPEPQTCEPVPEHHRQDAVVERAQARALDDVVEDMHRERWRETRRRREGSSERRGRELGEPRRVRCQPLQRDVAYAAAVRHRQPPQPAHVGVHHAREVRVADRLE